MRRAPDFLVGPTVSDCRRNVNQQRVTLARWMNLRRKQFPHRHKPDLNGFDVDINQSTVACRNGGHGARHPVEAA
jgi:hypothetical protein